MADNVYTVEKLNELTYRIDEFGRDNCYLLLGSEKALLIDTTLGAGDLYSLVKSITDLPLAVALTHAHGDHGGGAYQFGTVYVPKEECTLNYRFQNTRTNRVSLLSNRMKENGINEDCIKGNSFNTTWLPFDESLTFDLGGRLIRVIKTPGHTVSDMVFVDDTMKMIFTGDAACPVLPMNTYRCLSLEEWLPGGEAILELLKTHEGWCGHSDGRLSFESHRKNVEYVKEIIEKYPQNTQKSERAYYPEFSKYGCVIFNTKKIHKQADL